MKFPVVSGGTGHYRSGRTYVSVRSKRFRQNSCAPALVRLFGFERSMRGVRRTDFHTTEGLLGKPIPEKQRLWIEAHFEFPELKDTKSKYATIPSNFAHMQLLTIDDVPCVRIRLTAEMDSDGEIDEECLYVLEADTVGEPTKTAVVSRHDRDNFQVHYLPARRDPADHVSYAATTLLGRALRAANWTTERESIIKLSENISKELANNAAIADISSQLNNCVRHSMRSASKLRSLSQTEVSMPLDLARVPPLGILVITRVAFCNAHIVGHDFRHFLLQASNKRSAFARL